MRFAFTNTFKAGDKVKAVIKKTVDVFILQFFWASDIFGSPLVIALVPEQALNGRK